MVGPPVCPDNDCTVPGCREYYDNLAHYHRLRIEARDIIERMVARNPKLGAVTAEPDR